MWKSENLKNDTEANITSTLYDSMISQNYPKIVNLLIPKTFDLGKKYL